MDMQVVPRATEVAPPVISAKNHDVTMAFDIGFHDGGDSAYYLSRGMKVVAVEANPELVSFGRERFCREIEGGDLVLHHGAVVGRPQSSAIRLYVNHRDSGSSSVHENWRAGDEHYIVEAPPTTIAELIKNHGMPSYIKIDIEGADEDVISNLPSEFAPAYLSCEMSFSGEVLDLLVDLGYTEFKLINQATFTQSTEILDPEIAMRALRKAGTLFPRFEDVVRNLPDYLRPSRIMQDSFREDFPYKFPKYSSGPFCEDTCGPWRSADYVRRSIEGLKGDRGLTYDLHAKTGCNRRKIAP